MFDENGNMIGKSSLHFFTQQNPLNIAKYSNYENYKSFLTGSLSIEMDFNQCSLQLDHGVELYSDEDIALPVEVV